MTEHLTDDSTVERALRAGLEEFDLSEEDRALVDGELDDDGYAREEGPRPVVAVVGRPNVGKSTFVNRILGRREAVVEDVPGVTRDRVAYDADWAGRRFTLVDTGGWEIDATGIHLRVAEQAEVAVELADVVMFVVDAVVHARGHQIRRRRGHHRAAPRRVAHDDAHRRYERRHDGPRLVVDLLAERVMSLVAVRVGRLGRLEAHVVPAKVLEIAPTHLAEALGLHRRASGTLAGEESGREGCDR